MLCYINPMHKTLSETEFWGMAGEWRIRHTEAINNLYPFPNIIHGEIKEEEMVESSSIHREMACVVLQNYGPERQGVRTISK